MLETINVDVKALQREQFLLEMLTEKSKILLICMNDLDKERKKNMKLEEEINKFLKKENSDG